MRSFAVISLLALGLVFQASASLAVQPDEVLSDPALETRARAISSELRCMVCQNQSIDDSDADLARDLRLLVRDRLKAGDSDEQVMDYVVSRYGEFVLLRPSFSARNLLLWAMPAIVLLIGAAGFFAYVRRGSAALASGSSRLSAEEEQRLTKILGEGD
ncbi:MAG: cytochrome c-type biogenesis protein CcmH [Nitratireductor sp.]|nr:cytochrome c-type biogenesis protein CcmH [Nitratireductor sp.]